MARSVQTLTNFLCLALSAPEGTRKCSLCNNSISSSDKCRAVFRCLQRAFHKHQKQVRIRRKKEKEREGGTFFLELHDREISFESCAKSAIAIDFMIITWQIRCDDTIVGYCEREKRRWTKENTEIQKETTTLPLCTFCLCITRLYYRLY